MKRWIFAMVSVGAVSVALGKLVLLRVDSPETSVRTISGSVTTSAGLPVAGVPIVPHTYGDLNNDGRVDLRDVAKLQQGTIEAALGTAGTWPVMRTQLRGPVFDINDPTTW